MLASSVRVTHESLGVTLARLIPRAPPGNPFAECEIIAIGRRVNCGRRCDGPAHISVGQAAASVVRGSNGSLGVAFDEVRRFGCGLRADFKLWTTEFLNLEIVLLYVAL